MAGAYTNTSYKRRNRNEKFHRKTYEVFKSIFERIHTYCALYGILSVYLTLPCKMI